MKTGGEIEPIICIELEENHLQDDLNELKQELLTLASKHEMTKPIKHVMFHPRFPVDIRHNAKIGREQLALWAKGELS